MNFKNISTTLLVTLFFAQAFSQGHRQSLTGTTKNTLPSYNYSVSTPYLSFLNFGAEKTNTHHYEFHIGYKLTPNDRISIKIATWKLFAPMGIQLWDPLFRKESEFFSGRLRESGIGITYQRLLWKGLFAQIEILPLWKTYLDEAKNKIDNGFKLYTTCKLPFFSDHLKMENRS